MTDDRDPPAPQASDSHVCPQCLNPHTIVVDLSYRGMMRFCPMCDHSWVIGQVNRDG